MMISWIEATPSGTRLFSPSSSFSVGHHSANVLAMRNLYLEPALLADPARPPGNGGDRAGHVRDGGDGRGAGVEGGVGGFAAEPEVAAQDAVGEPEVGF